MGQFLALDSLPRPFGFWLPAPSLENQARGAGGSEAQSREAALEEPSPGTGRETGSVRETQNARKGDTGQEAGRWDYKRSKGPARGGSWTGVGDLTELGAQP